jgi:hypothetical protein
MPILREELTPLNCNQKPFVIIKCETREFVNDLKSIAAKASIQLEEDELIVNDESVDQ